MIVQIQERKEWLTCHWVADKMNKDKFGREVRGQEGEVEFLVYCTWTLRESGARDEEKQWVYR